MVNKKEELLTKQANFILAPIQEEKIRIIVESGRYPSKSVFVREAIREKLVKIESDRHKY
ncbi:MAG: hypothetical protein ABIH20_04630 [Candidatus Diapherotrites archaeon]